MSGVVYIFTFPCMLKIASLKKEKALTTANLTFYVIVMIIGILNLMSQFFISDY